MPLEVCPSGATECIYVNPVHEVDDLFLVVRIIYMGCFDGWNSVAFNLLWILRKEFI